MKSIIKLKRMLGILSSDEYVNWLRSTGIDIGKEVKFFDTKNVIVDVTRPWLISIGNYTKITSGVVILSHDYSLSVLRRVYGEWIGEAGKTKIGDNCFIGINSIILMGTNIGNNVIVGAGSVVNGIIPDNVVIAGNPARIICSLEEYYNKRKSKTVDEAMVCINEYKNVYGVYPKPRDLEGFKFLFAPRDADYINNNQLSFKCSGDEPDEVKQAFFESVPVFESFEELLEKAERNH